MIKKLILTVFLAIGAMASSLTQGSEIPTLTIKDQFEKEHVVDASVKTILFSATKDESAVIRDFIDSKGKAEFLTSNNIAYIADITGMPSLITKWFAMPKMQKYEFPILLIDEANKSLFPVKEDMISIITVVDGKVSDVKYVKTIEELTANF
jgi:hypothetical protein